MHRWQQDNLSISHLWFRGNMHINSRCFVCLEAGLRSAQRCTDALYSGTAVALSELSSEELRQLFKEATSVELMLEPGTTLFDVVMRAKCFRHDSGCLLL